MGKGVLSAVITVLLLFGTLCVSWGQDKAVSSHEGARLASHDRDSESKRTDRNGHRQVKPQGTTKGPAASAGKGDRTALKVQSDAEAPSDTVRLPDLCKFSLLSEDPLELVQLDDIKPLYTSPSLPGEGLWRTAYSPRDSSRRPVIYTTFYRPSVNFPNALVYMMVIDMRRTFMQYYVGSQEPAARVAASEVESEMRPWVVAITNAMWMQRHSRGAGAIFRGRVVYPMVNGMATLIVYRDGSVDIQEWSPDIPVNIVRDARQLRYLIVKNGMVVKSVLREGRLEDSEIGLGFLLGGGGKDYDGGHAWYVADRSAFGIRRDGNLVFAIGHHIGTQDLAKALVLAGCERGIHADANPSNIVGNLYVRDPQGTLVRKSKLSPEQSKYALKRYDYGYTKDYFAFFFRPDRRTAKRALTRRNTRTRSR